MFKCSIKVKQRTNNIDKTMDKISNALPAAIESAMKKGQEEALNNKRGSKDINLIPYEVNSGKDEAIGKLYTNFDYAPFLEYGTGVKSDGTLPHIGKTKTFLESGMRYWYMPKELADAKGKEFNPQRIIEIDGKEFYLMFATQPYPFMRPTAFMLEDKARNIVAEEIRKRLKG